MRCSIALTCAIAALDTAQSDDTLLSVETPYYGNSSRENGNPRNGNIRQF